MYVNSLKRKELDYTRPVLLLIIFISKSSTSCGVDPF